MITRISTRAARSTARTLAQHSRASQTCLPIQQCRAAVQQRCYSTPEAPAKPIDLRSQFQSSPTPPPPPPPSEDGIPKPKRSLRPYIYATLCLFLGISAGSYVSLVLAPPPLPQPDSAEDKLMVEFLHKRASNLPVVQSLSEDPAWTSWEAYDTIGASERSKRLTTGPLSGARSLGGYQRIFHNATTGELVSVVWFGGALAGWPGVTHGGLIATVLDECLGRCAIMQFPSRTGVTANLELTYLKPSVTNEFYVARAVPVLEGKTERKAWVQGRLEGLDGRVYVEAKALFVVPKMYATREIKEKF
ncbi:hypothetical protein BP6252_04787 [Coleophoma cylindrospora]|uniref:Thioesterase domain-containing protein n=1 Tax=Coleophoma cylindrospora TaxID=1849047 RepID=A0A3D8S1H8_9HELO|nr:hypothetical protein BP6252_04787 [Coleophoma cylindrospora]